MEHRQLAPFALLLACSCAAGTTHMETSSSTSRLVPEDFEPVTSGTMEGVWEGAPATEAELEAEAAMLSAPRDETVAPEVVAVEASTPKSAEPQAESGAGPSSDDVSQANNPLANFTALNFQNYYIPDLTDMPNQTANSFWIRYVKPVDKWLIRASLPMNRTPTSAVSSESGMGDLNAFGAYILSEPTSKTTYGVGPLMVIPTATNDAVGSGKWQIGAAAVYFNAESPEIQYGGLMTWQTDFAGSSSRAGTNLLTLQYFAFYQLGQGSYLRSAPIMSFDLENSNYNVPVGIGYGKVFKLASGNMLNVFMEPQFSILHDGPGQAAYQLFIGVNNQF